MGITDRERGTVPNVEQCSQFLPVICEGWALRAGEEWEGSGGRRVQYDWGTAPPLQHEQQEAGQAACIIIAVDPKLNGVARSVTTDPQLNGVARSINIDPQLTGVARSIAIDPQLNGVARSITIDPQLNGVAISITIDPQLNGVARSVTINPQ